VDAKEKGSFTLATGVHFGDKEINQGLKTSQDAKFYAISAPLDEPITEADKDLIFQFSVKHEQNIDCGGGYLKLTYTDPDFDPLAFGGQTPYAVMFGPDICGSGTRRIHLIFTYKGNNLLWKKDARCETDTLTHVYTLIVHGKENAYEVLVDLKKVESGSLYDDWEFLPPKEIPDPAASKPGDWVDEETIPDPDDKKPEGWDDIPASIVDPEATMPEEWDEGEDGRWEAPHIPNPEFKGNWKPKMIPNPDFKGPWSAPLIANADYVYDDNLFKTILGDGVDRVGIEIWQVKSGTIFDSVMVTDDWEEAQAYAKESFEATIEAEKKMKEAEEEEERKRREEERVRREEEEKKRREEENDEDEEQEDEEEEEEEEEDRLKKMKVDSKRKARLEELRRKAQEKPAGEDEYDEL